MDNIKEDDKSKRKITRHVIGEKCSNTQNKCITERWHRNPEKVQKIAAMQYLLKNRFYSILKNHGCHIF